MYKSLSPEAIGIKAELEEALDLVASSGFSGLDAGMVGVKSLVDERGADEVNGLFASKGVRFGAWGMGIPWNGPEDEYKEGVKHLPELASTAAAVGAFRCVQWVPPSSEDRRFRENFHWHVGRLRPIAEILKENGCSLGLEFIGPRTLREETRFGFIYTIGGMLALSEAIGTGNVGLLLDAWHWYTALGTEADLAMLAPEDVVHVHVNDAPRGRDLTEQIDHERALPSETGVIDLVGFLKQLKEIGYDGPVTPEPFSQRVRKMAADEAVRVTHEGLDQAWQSAGLA